MLVQRDYNRFKRMSEEQRATLPIGYSAELEIVPLRVQIAREQQKRRAVVWYKRFLRT